ncbi:splicing factor, arginine/serine-rich 19 isoform 3-T5 [Rhynchonycteris naso]
MTGGWGLFRGFWGHLEICPRGEGGLQELRSICRAICSCRLTMEEEDESRGKTEESGEDRGDGPPDRDPTLSPTAFILRAIQQAVGSSLQGDLANEKDGSRCHGLRWRRCRSPRSESRSQESGGTDTAAVLDMAADSFLAGLVSILDPPDTWVPSHLDLRPGESEDMLELVAEVRIGDRDPIPLPVPSLLPRLRAWRTGKTEPSAAGGLYAWHVDISLPTRM